RHALRPRPRGPGRPRRDRGGAPSRARRRGRRQRVGRRRRLRRGRRRGRPAGRRAHRDRRHGPGDELQRHADAVRLLRHLRGGPALGQPRRARGRPLGRRRRGRRRRRRGGGGRAHHRRGRGRGGRDPRPGGRRGARRAVGEPVAQHRAAAHLRRRDDRDRLLLPHPHRSEAAHAHAAACGRGAGPVAGGRARHAGPAGGRRGPRARGRAGGAGAAGRQHRHRGGRGPDVAGRDRRRRRRPRPGGLRRRGPPDHPPRPRVGDVAGGDAAMSLAWRELVRRPGRFAVAGGALTLLVVLLLLLGGLLDGLYLGSTGAIRAQRADVFVYSATARDSIVRSRIEPDLRARIEEVDGVAPTGGLGVARPGAPVRGDDDVLDVAVTGYELAPEGVPEPPAPGTAYADDRLRADGVRAGDVLEVGPARVPVEVVDFVSDTSYLQQGALWVEPDTWRAIQSESRPDAAVADGVFQVVLVVAEDGVEAGELADRIDEATGGATSSLTRDEAVLSLPGIRQQNSVFTALIGVTLFVAGLVAALFFALVTLERTS